MVVRCRIHHATILSVQHQQHQSQTTGPRRQILCDCRSNESHCVYTRWRASFFLTSGSFPSSVHDRVNRNPKLYNDINRSVITTGYTCIINYHHLPGTKVHTGQLRLFRNKSTLILIIKQRNTTANVIIIYVL
ncbi:hypothetical protein NP493_980g00069 [Ridgeia piscesae]|uniref:Uncharacterized protein n=1 Tax=Ridgeia piscesae TaxID=27915 RepID=A0AAD9KIX2_RIDPI|nr:hypothetical protein NP493_980g00069 [Ridgeia piscesae]